MRNRAKPAVVIKGRRGSRWLRRLAPWAALAYLHFVFTFENVVATPFVRWPLSLSLEIAFVLAIVAMGVRFGWRPGRLLTFVFALSVYVLWLLRYVDRTALGVLGREFNLHGDFPHLHRVGAMFYESMSARTAAAAAVVVALMCVLPLVLNALSFSCLRRRFESGVWPWGMLGVCIGGVWLHSHDPDRASYSTTEIALRQVNHLLSDEALIAQQEAAQWPSIDLPPALEGLAGADVYLIFLESYGVTLIEDEHHYSGIRSRLEAFEQGVRADGYAIRSHRIHSPTFGGGSWRAHASFLAGVDVQSEHHYNALLGSSRKTLVHAFKRAGYRTVAVEPGIQWFWPDGQFYGFETIYDAAAIDYRGPAMGWWKIPDQFTLYRLAKSELETRTQPIFAKLSLIMTHIPYYPIPPYVEDWSLFESGEAFDRGLKSIAHDDYRDLTELSTRYVRAFEYELDVLQGFLTEFAPDNSMVIVVGDHQPPKLVTHDNDSWATPIHVFSRDEGLVTPFEEWGFESGMRPMADTGFRMDQFLSRFLDTFAESGPDSAAVR